MRVHEQCGRNVTATAQCLRMHRRSLQRILGKRAPQLRAETIMRESPSPEVIGASMLAVGDANSHAARCELQAKENKP